MNIYGIKTCGSVKKAMQYMKKNNIEYTFIDFKKEAPSQELIASWLEEVSMDVLFNKKGRKYRDLKLKDLNLTDEDKKEWLVKEFLLVKRPVIEHHGQVIIGFDETRYDDIFKS